MRLHALNATPPDTTNFEDGEWCVQYVAQRSVIFAKMLAPFLSADPTYAEYGEQAPDEELEELPIVFATYFYTTDDTPS